MIGNSAFQSIFAKRLAEKGTLAFAFPIFCFGHEQPLVLAVLLDGSKHSQQALQEALQFKHEGMMDATTRGLKGYLTVE